MKIDNTLREAYARQLEINKLVEKEIQQLRSLLDKNWHFTSRLKSEESFAQKVEAGRVSDDLTIEDFFACTIVVRSASELRTAEEFIKSNFTITERRPLSQHTTKARPTDFRFDDIRIYAKLTPNYLGPQPIHQIVFEIQVKTFLQHAWAIATHDLTYKTNEVNWAKLRVAHQIKAMLEHAELSIEQFQQIAQSDLIAKSHSDYDELNSVINFLFEQWPASALPRDLQRLAEAVRNAARTLNVTLPHVFESVRQESSAGSGAQALDLSPLNAIVQSVLRRVEIDPKRVPKRIGAKIAISRAVKIPSYLDNIRDKIFLVY